MKLKYFSLLLLLLIGFQISAASRPKLTSIDCPSPTITSFLPTEAPVDAQVVIIGTDFLNTASVEIDGINANFTIISDTEIEVIVPNGITNDAPITITSSGGCIGNTSTNFSIISSDCTNNTSEIFISEVYDAISGSYGIYELYNPGNTAVVLDGIYQIDRYGNIGNATPSVQTPLMGTINPQSVFLIQLGSNNECGISPNMTLGAGINENDEIQLLKNGTLIDVMYTDDERGYSFVRNPDAQAPKTTFDITDWMLFETETCANTGTHSTNMTSDVSVSDVFDVTTCTAGTVGMSTAVDDNTTTYNFQWKVLDDTGNWVNLTDGLNYSGTNTSQLNIISPPIEFDGNQYYCEITATDCFLVTNAFQLTVLFAEVDNIGDQTACGSFTLPAINNGNYFDNIMPNGMPTDPLFAGDVINTSTTIYVYNEVTENGIICMNNQSFSVTITGNPPVDTLADQTECASYTLPTLTNGNYFTASGGNGTMLNAGDVITTTQQIFIYNEVGTASNACSNESNFNVTIIGNPPVDNLANQTECASYTLPTLTNGNYFTQTNGGGMMLNAGDIITTTQQIFIYNEVGTAPNTCSNESNFNVTIIGNPPVDNLADQTECESYTLPTLTNGNYFTASNGNGTMLNAGDIISTSQQIFIYNQAGTAPNTCSNESNFNVTIIGNPPIDTLADQTECTSYTLPTLTNGNYFTASGGNGTMLNAGDIISTSQTIFIYNEVGTAPNSCSNESDFNVTIIGNPPVDTLADQTECVSYTLPTLTNGDYFTASGGNGTMLNAGDVITTTQQIFIYNQAGTAPNTCSSESSFNVTIIGNPPVDSLNDESVCNEFILPNLTNGNYFTASGGNGTMLNAGDIISTSQQLFIYNESGSAPNICTNQSNFSITIVNEQPIQSLPDEFSCGSFTLPTLNSGTYYTSADQNGTQLNAGDVITTDQDIFIYDDSGICPEQFMFGVTITPQPMVDELLDVTECSSYVLPSLNEGNYFTASGGSGTTLNAGDIISTSQTIFIYAEEISTTNSCNDESSFEVTIFPATDFDLSLDNIAINGQDILVTMDDNSVSYQYAVDNTSFQSSNQFFDLSEDMHTLFVQDINGCVQKSVQFTIEIEEEDIFEIPLYFTPNGDGQHDTWLITDNQNRVERVYIFNRFGKLLKSLGNPSGGWNGIYNGNLMPSSDYWYQIRLRNGEELLGHFTLKR